MQPSPLNVPQPGIALVEALDKKLLIHLRDGRKLLGILRSFDQFANLIIEHTVERVIVGSSYFDKVLGLQVVRGENVVLLGEVDEAREPPPTLRLVSEAEIKAAQQEEAEAEKIKGLIRARLDFLDFE